MLDFQLFHNQNFIFKSQHDVRRVSTRFLLMKWGKEKSYSMIIHSFCLFLVKLVVIKRRIRFSWMKQVHIINKLLSFCGVCLWSICSYELTNLSIIDLKKYEGLHTCWRLLYFISIFIFGILYFMPLRYGKLVIRFYNIPNSMENSFMTHAKMQVFLAIENSKVFILNEVKSVLLKYCDNLS